MTSAPFFVNQLFFLTAVGVWAGAIVVLSAAAPVVFKIEDSRDRAAALVGALLATVNRLKLLCAAVIAATVIVEYLLWRDGVSGRLAARYGLLGGIGAMAAVSAWITTPVLRSLGERVGSFDRAERSAARRRFGDVHTVNSTVTAVELFALVAVFYTV